MADSTRLLDLLIRCQQLRDDGQTIALEQLCRDDPQLLDALKKQVEALRCLAASLNAGAGSQHPSMSNPTLPPADGEGVRFRGENSWQVETLDAPGDGSVPFVTRQETPPFPYIPGYEILGELGRGGMGVVYKARQVGLSRFVALKMILVGAYAGTEEIARFRTEAESVARLKHPNIVQIHEIGEHSGMPYFSLEYCEGGSLATKLSGTPLPPLEAAKLVKTLALAVDAAHQKNIIHRDLKPHNVLLAEDGTPKITDFGLAKKLNTIGDLAGPGRQLGEDAGLTRSGAVMGTPSYMAPEQAAGKTKEIGPAADVYALGAILYECLTGRPPFKAATAVDTILQVLCDEAIPPARLNREIPRDLDTICLHCLQKEPPRRFLSALAVADDLGRYLAGEPIRARPVGLVERTVKWARKRPAAAALAAMVILALVAGAAALIWHQKVRNDLTAQALCDRLLTANTSDVAAIVADMGPYRPRVDPILKHAYKQAEGLRDNRKQLHASLALLPVDPTQAEYLCERLLDADPHDVPVIREALLPHRNDLLLKLWAVVEQPTAGKVPQRLRAACALARYDADGRRWAKVDASVANDLVTIPAVSLGAWMDSLRPVSGKLLKPLAAIFRDPKRRETERSLATDILADYAADQPGTLAMLLLDADATQFAVLFAKLRMEHDAARKSLDSELSKQPPPARPTRADKLQEVLRLQGAITDQEEKVRISVKGQVGELPAKLHEINLDARKKYTIHMTSGELDAFLVVQDKSGKLLAFDNDSGGGLDAKIDFTPAKDDTYKVYSASLKGTGVFTLTILDGSAREWPAKEQERLAMQDAEAREALAKRQANAAVALLRLGQADKVWPFLKHSADPRRRSYLIRQLVALGSDPKHLTDRLWTEPDSGIRRALLLALGEFGADRLATRERASLVAKIVDLYRDDPDPGIHGTAAWLLGQWGHVEMLRQIDSQLSTKQKSKLEKPISPGWYVNGQGQTMIVLGPVKEFWMGSPPYEANREGGSEGKLEARHKRHIGRTFAIAAREVTVKQFLHFRARHDYDRQFSPTPDCPANAVTWYLAAEYCNWLCQQEGIPEDQWCYLKNSQGQYAEGMKPAADYLKRTGYRLPTEAEWEHACRAEADTSRYFGETDELLPRYAWYTKNSLDRWMLPAGSLLPNDFGFFDMLGNALEWCHDPYSFYPAHKGANAIADQEFTEKEVLDKRPRVMRGGGAIHLGIYLRSAVRFTTLPPNRLRSAGFRVARTLAAE